MIAKKIHAGFNEQINRELYSAYGLDRELGKRELHG